ncbi:carboxymuconolactone decarboxylase family protein [Rhodospirillaceae bacterium SYSU D60014]|uniref:carboxymuconolactone decarboxylase family protein n=1 Tax=Virgifigura deserti TaxID=2268457 RepID=UPI000E66DF14
MSIDALKSRLPDYAKDLKLNLSGLPSTPGLTPQQLWGTILAAAVASRNGEVITAIADEARQHLDEAALQAAKAASAMMSMTNIYYRFTHLVGNKEYATMPAKLRMNILANPGVDKVDFELWSLAVSAVNGCGTCIDAHEREVVGKGLTKEAVQNAVRIAAVLYAVSTVLEAESALAGETRAAA